MKASKKKAPIVMMTEAQYKRWLVEQRKGEPNWKDKVLSGSAVSDAFAWYTRMYSVEDGHSFIIDYLKGIKGFNKADLDAIKATDYVDLVRVGQSAGWFARILSMGGKFESDASNRFGKKLYALVDLGKSKRENKTSTVPTVDIQQRMREKVSDYIGRIEEELDTFSLEGANDFDVKDWISKNEIKPLLAKQIAEKFKPVYAEMYEASLGKDVELKAAYAHFKKGTLKMYLDFMKNIIAALEGSVINAVKVPRKARKKKIKPAVVVVAKMKYAKEDVALKVKSIAPTSIIGAQQLWVYNNKTRMLGVYKAIGPAGFSVKGATIQGFDETVSISKKLRKPEVSVPEVVNAGKVALRTLLDKVRSKSKPLTGRINADTILLRVM